MSKSDSVSFTWVDLVILYSAGGDLVTKSFLTIMTLMRGSSVHGILQARILEWVAISFSRGFSQPRNQPGSPALQAVSLLTELEGKTLYSAN